MYEATVLSSGMLDGKVVIITGGEGEGLGQTLVKEACFEGAHVVACGLDANAGEAFAAGMREKGFPVLWVRADLCKADEADRVATAGLKEFGRIDCLINSACLAPTDDRDVGNTPLAVVMDAIRDNFAPAYNCTRAVLPYMRSQGWGAIVHVSSINADAPGFGQIGYACGKKALEVLSGNIIATCGESVRSNVALLATLPNKKKSWALRDKLFPLLRKALAWINPSKRVPTQTEIAGTVLWLVSDRAAFVSGNKFRVDGGLLALKVPFHGGNWFEELCRQYEALAIDDPKVSP